MAAISADEFLPFFQKKDGEGGGIRHSVDNTRGGGQKGEEWTNPPFPSFFEANRSICSYNKKVEKGPPLLLSSREKSFLVRKEVQ